MLTENNIQFAIHYMYCSNGSIMVPNYTPYRWFECDMFGLTKSGYMREWEIKLSRSDFFADRKKGSGYKYHCLENNYAIGPKNFWYVVPENMVKADEVPDFAGLIYASIGLYKGVELEEVKKAPKIHGKKIDEKIMPKLLSNVYHRYWTLKYELNARSVD